MKELEKDLKQVERELATGKRILRATKKKTKTMKHTTKDHDANDNAARSLKTIRKGVQFLEERREVLQERADADDMNRPAGGR